ncbi:BTB/POZ and TAZ domain-containing protein 3 isoform X1 [Phoenix dactylifera]|uniref:BTB/POZ and TAZ domain-containing protein 3 isoform X1 n=1 Tax=Phoenix dactylifera TaxID=42345 RepID=A0A8B7BYU7_PHODC|nr:BTB/POZ and TAZ domain-containing protein 3 isoform X1 [Phoenix dactylifera]XP_008788167.2 BTB/POZ and TAZ domain-containing protein 3 isoform X1 [Phoenix dactylifera]XP_008788168.2 BTB/POZ and TAZ domain-containing protein 3 isoform X1 [Phoenix dactylifera]XP_008788169.2 BTB/POZ and TAZ domain-containing protein 3 isoform X1 [Phoenix dactylifera]
MACLELDSPQLFSNFLSYDGPFNLHLDGSISAELLSVSDACTSSQSHCSNIPKPPPLPGASYSRNKLYKKLQGYSIIPDETKHAWDRLFYEGYEADVHVLTDDKGIILAHSSVLGITSPVLRSMLELARVKGGFRCIKIPGVPSEAARAFIRFLYSSCYELDAMKKFVLHLLVMSHTFSVPSLKRACIKELETTLLTKENVVDVLQLARECDAPRLSFLCTSLIIKEFKAVSVSEGWKVMKQANPHLEQELLETLVEADSKKQERAKKMEERKVYMQLFEAMEALLHICRDGCRTIGPRDKMLKDNQAACNFSACKGLELLVRHFSGCKTRVPGGCAHCKRMWQLLELHSCMCYETDSCKVPLCSHFKDKMRHLSKKEELKWKLLVSKVMAAEGTISSISARRPLVT